MLGYICTLFSYCSDIHNYVRYYDKILQNTVSSLNNTQLLLVGDFNFIDIDTFLFQSSKFIDFLHNNMLLQHANPEALTILTPWIW